MMIINGARWILAMILALVLFPIAWVCFVLTLLVGLILGFIEELGLDTGIVGETFIKLAGKWQKIYKGIILKVATINAHL